MENDRRAGASTAACRPTRRQLHARWPIVRIAAAVALLAATAGVYAPVRNHGFFVLDDPFYVADNPVVRAGLSAEGLRWAFTNPYVTWHPVTWLSLMLDSELFGADPGALHLVNLALHVANTALLLAILAAFTGAFWRSAVVAGLFALHPLHVESVAWIAERKDVLSTFFALLAMAAHGAYVRQPGRLRYALVVTGFVLAVLAKPVWVVLPLLLLVLDFWPLERLRRGERPGSLLAEKLPLLALAAAAGLVTLHHQQAGGSLVSSELMPLGARVANALTACWSYLAHSVWPDRLAVYYPFPQQTALLPAVASAAGLIAVTAAAGWQRRRRPFLLAGWLVYGIALLPVIGIVQSGSQAMADRYTYVPLIGIFLAAVWGLAEGAEALRLPRSLLALAAGAMLVACAGASRAQLGLWRDDVALLEHTLAVTGPNPIAHHTLATALLRDGDPEGAIRHFREATRLEPRLAEAWYDLGFVLARQGRLDEAIGHYGTALGLAPEEPRIHVQLGIALAARGRPDEAARHYREALRLAPRLLQARSNLGLLHLQRGELDAASEQFRRALEQAPDFVAARVNLGLTLARQGALGEAEAELREALRQAPGFVPARLHLALVLGSQGRHAEAIAELEEILRAHPGHEQAERSLARMRARAESPAGQTR